MFHHFAGTLDHEVSGTELILEPGVAALGRIEMQFVAVSAGS
jgi:hypothetical protein